MSFLFAMAQYLRLIRDYITLPLLIFWGYRVVSVYYDYHLEDFAKEIKREGSIVAAKGLGKVVEVIGFLDKLAYIDQMLGILLVVYLLYVGYRFFIQESNTIRLQLTPLLVVLSSLALTLFIYLALFVDNPQLRYVVENNVVTAKVSVLTVIGSFLSKGLPNLLGLFLISFFTAALGSQILKWLKIESPSLLLHFLLSSGLGYAGLILFLLLAALSGLYTALFVGITLLLVAGLLYREIWNWLKVFATQPIVAEFKLYDLRILALAFIMIIISDNFIFLMRYMPIGWDDIGTYMNNVKLTVSYGELISGVNPYYWELVMGLGLLLGKTVSMALNLSFWPGIYNILLIYAFARHFISEKVGLIAAAIFYTMPMVQHFSHADMKIDGALFFFSILALYCVFEWKLNGQPESHLLNEEKNAAEENDEVVEIKQPGFWRQHQYLILAGLFVGIAIGVKQTTIYLLFSLIVFLAWHYFAWSGALGFFLLQTWVLIKMNLFPVGDIVAADHVAPATQAVLALAVLALGFALLRGIRKIAPAAVSMVLLVAVAALPMVPWLYHNYAITGQLNYSGLMVGKNPHRPVVLAEQVGVDPTQCTATAFQEEVYRYLGYEEGLEKYLRLPWRLMTNELVDLSHVNISYLFLLFLPFLFFYPERVWRNTGTRFLAVFAISFFFIWLFTARGIIWYALPGFLALCIFVELIIFDYLKNWTRYLALSLLALSLCMMFYIRASDVGVAARSPIYEYIYGKKDEATVNQQMLPYFAEIAQFVSEAKEKYPERYYLYQAGTFITYFIPFNDQYTAKNDPQLDFFKCLLDASNDSNREMAKKLKQLGFRYMMIDLFTASIEVDTEGTLHKKVGRLVNFLNDSSVAKIIFKKPGYAFVELID